MHAFCSEDTPPPCDYGYYWFKLDPKSNQDKVNATKFLMFNSTHLLKFLNKMCKYEMGLASIVVIDAK